MFWIASETMQGLVDHLALVLGEHMATNDELHVTYNAMQSGWLDHPGRQGTIWQRAKAPWTELQFEYSTFVVLRDRGHPDHADEQ